MPGRKKTTPGAELSRRELEVLQGLADDLQEKQIADRLGIRPLTVQEYKGTMYRKLGVRGAHGAVAAGFRRGLVK